MKKKLVGLLLIIFFSCGCTSIESQSYEDIIDSTLSNTIRTTNITRAGYKYYLPQGMRLIEYEGSNEIISHNNDTYYLYVDYVSYYNKVVEEYEEKTDVVYSKALKNGDSFGYIEIKNTSNDKYFIEIMYNYANIEVIVDEEEANVAIAYATSILSSIQYQDTVLEGLMGDDALSANEVEHNIFESADTESEYLEIVEEYGTYEEESNSTVDPDFIRR